MADMSAEAEKLANMTRPADLVSSEVLRDTPTTLRMHTASRDGEMLLTEERAAFRPLRTPKKHQKANVWDGDIRQTSGAHDASSLDRPKKNFTSWLVGRGAATEGPYSDREVRALIDEGRLRGTMIKRDFDKGFVSTDDLLRRVPNIFSSKDLNKYFSENQTAEECSSGEPCFTAERSSKLVNFMKANGISASVGFIVKTVRDMRKSQAVEAIKDITGLDSPGNTMLIELIVESAGCQILSDVDKDGFHINPVQRSRKGSQH